MARLSDVMSPYADNNNLMAFIDRFTLPEDLSNTPNSYLVTDANGNISFSDQSVDGVAIALAIALG